MSNKTPVNMEGLSLKDKQALLRLGIRDGHYILPDDLNGKQKKINRKVISNILESLLFGKYVPDFVLEAAREFGLRHYRKTHFISAGHAFC